MPTTRRNLHGFDPFRIPSAYAVQDGARQADRLLARHQADGHVFPESIALVRAANSGPLEPLFVGALGERRAAHLLQLRG
jgi:hypothetical protein